jgi:hypothetical protein
LVTAAEKNKVSLPYIFSCEASNARTSFDASQAKQSISKELVL